MKDANAPRWEIDKTDLKNAWKRMLFAFVAALLVFIDQMIPGIKEVIQSIDFDSMFGQTLGPLITSAIAAGFVYLGTLVKGFLTDRRRALERKTEDGDGSVSGTGR